MKTTLYDYIAIALRQGAELMADGDNITHQRKACQHVASWLQVLDVPATMKSPLPFTHTIYIKGIGWLDWHQGLWRLCGLDRAGQGFAAYGLRHCAQMIFELNLYQNPESEGRILTH